MLSASGSILNKKLTDKFHKEAIMMYLGLSIMVFANFSILFTLFTRDPEDDSQPPFFPTEGTWGELLTLWANVVLIGLMGAAQQLCNIWALKLESSPGRVAIARSVNILVS